MHPDPSMPSTLLTRIHEGVFALNDGSGQHVGYFKWIQGQWKFKAVGYGPSGQVIPGGGPLTERHNTTMAQLDEAQIQAIFFKEE